MSHAARSIFVFGVYIVGLCAGLLVAPNSLLALIGQPATSEPYIRMLGLVGGILGAYYLMAARADLVPFFRATVWGRGVVAVGVAVLVALYLAPPILLAGAGMEIAGATWTAWALRSVSRAEP